jgi:hypothetical protein
MNIKLSPAVIAGLYKNSLVITEEFQEEQSPQQFTNKKTKDDTAIGKKWFLGDNQKNILILLKDESAVHINDEWLATLTKLLAACKLNIGDVAIVNYLHQNKSFTQLKEELQPEFLFMFDVTTNDIQLPFTIPHYQVQQYGGCTFIMAPQVTLTSENTDAIKAEKRKLWERMKILFKV